MTPSFKQLFEAIKERAKNHGDQIKVNFVKQCLKRVNPKVMTIMNIANDNEWKFIPKPDDAPDRGASNEAEFIAATKDRYYKQWLERVKKGEFDGKNRPDMHIGDDAPDEDESEEVDMAALARAEKEKAQKIAEAEKTPVAIINEPEEEEEEEDAGCEESCSTNQGECPNGMDCDLPSRQEEEESTPTPSLDGSPQTFTGTGEGEDEARHADAHSEMRLLDALSDFVTRTAVANDSPPEDTPRQELDVQVILELTERVTKLEKKCKSLFNAMRDE